MRRLPLTEELLNTIEICTCIQTKETMYGSSSMKWMASSIALQGACDRHWNPPFIYEQSLNNVGPCGGMRALSGRVFWPFQTDPRPACGAQERGRVLGD